MAVIKKVLIINDSGFERMVLRDQVKMLGYEVKTADEIAGLSMIKNFQPDIVIANLNMGDISGDKLIGHVKSINPAIRCYLSSCSKIDINQLDHHLIDGIIETPVNSTMLEMVLNEPAAAYTENELVPSSATRQSVCKSSAELFPTPQPVVKSCPSCQKVMENTEAQFAFCPYCGTRL